MNNNPENTFLERIAFSFFCLFISRHLNSSLKIPQIRVGAIFRNSAHPTPSSSHNHLCATYANDANFALFLRILTKISVNLKM